MTSIWQRCAAITLLTIGITISVHSGQAASAPATDVSLGNEYINITVNARDENTGRFSIKTTGGDPDRDSDDNAHLIYRRQDQKGPWTSFTTISIDNEPWVYGGTTRDSAGYGAHYGNILAKPTLVEGRQIDSAWQLGVVKATQSLSFVRSSTTGLRDTARIATELVNTDTKAHTVGLRIALDTMLGDNDGAPYRVGDSAITTDTSLSGASIPEFWQAFDSLADPKVTAQGTLRGGEVTTPDKVYFTNWGTLTEDSWKVNIVANRDFTREGGFDLDSAMALVWEPTTLAPGESRTIITYVGLGGLTIAPGQLRLAITSPSSVIATNDATFPVIAYVQNSGTGEARKVSATITLPTGLRLANGQSATRSLDNLPVGETGQIRWNVKVDGGSGQLTYRVGVTAMNADANTAARKIDIVSPAQLTVTIPEPEAKLTVAGGAWQPYPYVAQAVITNVGQAVAPGVTAQWESPRGLRLAAGDAPARNIGPLDPGESFTVKWHVIPATEAGDLPYKVTAALGAGGQPAAANGLVRVPPLNSSVSMAIERQGGKTGTTVVVGETFLVRIDARNLKSFQQAQLELLYDPTRLRLLGGSIGVDRGTLFVLRTDTTEPTGLGWDKPKVWVDMAKPLARVAVSGNRAQAPNEPLLSGSVAVLRMQALTAGSTNILIDKLSMKDKYEQDLLVNSSPMQIEVSAQ